MGKIRIGGPVELGSRDYVGPDVSDIADALADSRRARAQGHRRRPQFELSHATFQDVHRRVIDPVVMETRQLQVKNRGRVCCTLEIVSYRLVDRHRHRSR